MVRCVVLLISAFLASTAWGTGTPDLAKPKRFEIVRGMSDEARACLECHKVASPGLFADWSRSLHARSNVTCLDCHKADPTDGDIASNHDAVYNRTDLPFGDRTYHVPISGVVTPKDCSRCHPDEAEEFGRSKHAHTLEIIWKMDPWLQHGQNSETERQTGCYTCHGTVLQTENGKLTAASWPNVGVGRANLDGSLGSCSSCHTRHRFSVAEARKPEACGQCHLGPDHPQIEIYKESKHGAIADAEGHGWNWEAAAGTWTPGVYYRAPTCAACHMSGAGKVHTSHDVTERLSWELQTKASIRPQDFAAFPAKTDWRVERDRMKQVCLQCHGNLWVDSHYARLDDAIGEYNDVYYRPVEKRMNELYDKGLLQRKPFFDEPLEVEFYELWHHEGRRARMGVAMMAPDYAWWHGFYECKNRYMHFMRDAEELENGGAPSYRQQPYPNAGGTTTAPSLAK